MCSRHHLSQIVCLSQNIEGSPNVGVAQLVGHHPTRRVNGQFDYWSPHHAWVAGLVLGQGTSRGNRSIFLFHIHVFLPIFLPPFCISFLQYSINNPANSEGICTETAVLLQLLSKETPHRHIDSHGFYQQIFPIFFLDYLISSQLCFLSNILHQVPFALIQFTLPS